MATLYIVATPIGNLEDISLRAVRILKEVDFILCEDTRNTKVLLDRYQIKTSLLSYHQHSKLNKVNYIISLLGSGKNLALVSDAGTPGISDPGNLLVKEIICELGSNVDIVPLPGPSAALAALSVSGFPTDKFIFLGFPPQKNKRKKFFEEVVFSSHPVVFYESPYRIIKALEELRSVKENITLVVCRELTKKFETIYRGNPGEVMGKIKPGEIKGEFVIVAESKAR